METQAYLMPLAAMARKVRVPSKWLREQALSGHVPHLNADGQLLFNAEIVEAWLLSLASQHRAEKPEAVHA